MMMQNGLLSNGRWKWALVAGSLIASSPGQCMDWRERADLADLSPSEQQVQTCEVKLLDDNVAARVVAYTFAPVTIKGDRVVASGATMRKKGDWFRMTFDCTTSPDHLSVLALHYKQGDKVPRGQWDSLNLF